MTRSKSREPTAPSTLSRLPGPGRLLVTTSAGAWVVPSDGPIRRLGRFSGADWSPRGLYVVVTGSRRISAMEPDAALRWTFPRSREVSDPEWSPGDGFPDRVPRRELAADRGRRRSGRSPPGRGRRAGVARLATGPWLRGHVRRSTRPDRDPRGGRRAPHLGAKPGAHTAAARVDGGRPAAASAAPARAGRAGARRPAALRAPAPAGTVGEALAVHPSGRRAAVVVSGTGASRVLSIALDRPNAGPRSLFTARGRLTDVSWSPDGRWLLVAWRDADRWVLLRRDGERRLTLDDIAAQFDPGATGEASFPRIAGWIGSAQPVR